MGPKDHSANSAAVFHKLADRYRDKYMGLTLYDDSYRAFCELLPPGRVRVLDVACGPGNVSRFLITQRPELDLLWPGGRGGQSRLSKPARSS